jgi:hypothetical protein
MEMMEDKKYLIFTFIYLEEQNSLGLTSHLKRPIRLYNGA